MSSAVKRLVAGRAALLSPRTDTEGFEAALAVSEELSQTTIHRHLPYTHLHVLVVDCLGVLDDVVPSSLMVYLL
ncbi:hypothetical protein [Paenarthrobacter sp. YIM B13468]|uniref:hypothetical protein n=1 Tax=Paenarthrobacter sp. YIM B13468 TaxID=3366295 RepID=UPI0036731F18